MAFVEVHSETATEAVAFLLSREPGGFFKAGVIATDTDLETVMSWDDLASPEVAEVRESWNNAGASTVTPNFSIQLVERHYDFRQRDRVIEFLQERPFLVPLLLKARSKISQYFPGYPRVFLEVVEDPDVPEDVQLVASIRTGLSPDEALDKLDSFDKGWWLQSMEEANAQLCVHVEFA